MPGRRWRHLSRVCSPALGNVLCASLKKWLLIHSLALVECLLIRRPLLPLLTFMYQSLLSLQSNGSSQTNTTYQHLHLPTALTRGLRPVRFSISSHDETPPSQTQSRCEKRERRGKVLVKFVPVFCLELTFYAQCLQRAMGAAKSLTSKRLPMTTSVNIGMSMMLYPPCHSAQPAAEGQSL